MDDQFLHRLRRDPPSAFAARLKWQLDRPLATGRSRARVLLAFAIFGTAFALVSPQVRRTVGGLFEWQTGNPQATGVAGDLVQAPPAASIGVPRDAGTPRSAPRPRDGSAAAHFSGRQPPPAAGSDDPQTVIPDAQPIAGASLGTNFPGAQNLNPQVPLTQAIATVDTRQGLFKRLSFVMQPLGSVLGGHAPIDMQLVGTSASRLNELSSMIPEVFRTDTRSLDVKTRALDMIWTQPADFTSKADALARAADELEGAAATNDKDAVLRAVRGVAKACGDCHDSYRRN